MRRSGSASNLDGALADWPAVDGERKLTVEARVKTDAGIREVSLNATATAESNCGTTYLEWLSPVAIGGDQDWTRLVGTLELPEGTRSVHVFFWITASEESTGACVDEVCAYPGDPKPVEEDPPAESSSG